MPTSPRFHRVSARGDVGIAPYGIKEMFQ